MRELATDVAIIGAGTAGLNARREVERAGKRWLLIEAGEYGTTCARVGCMPSKLLIAAAEAAHNAREARQFGVHIDPAAIQIDGAAVMARVQRERDRFVRLVREDLEALPAEQRITGRARFSGPNTLIVDDHTRVQAHALVIATGSAPNVPKELAAAGDALLTSDSIFEIRALMGSVAVFGGGAIGLELGQALQFLGVRVRLYNPKNALGSFSDPEIARRFCEVISKAHDTVLGYEALEIERGQGSCNVRHRLPGGAWQSARFDRVLAATGRKPNVSALQLSAAGIALDDSGVPKFDRETMQCGTSAIFIAGDVAGDAPVMHEAVDEGAAAGANAARFPASQALARRVPLRIGFTTPRIATLGHSYREASEHKAVIGESSYADQGRARVIGQTQGHVRVYADRQNGCLSGAELFGPGVEHTAHLLAWAVAARLPLAELLRMPVYHPTLEEGIRTALRDAAKQLALLDDCAPADRGQGAGG
ncbi:MAG: hypothetical protein RL701_4933 [Pseudomonadota bacterium]|jgi:dihydrolipoamide dehydrogenase